METQKMIVQERRRIVYDAMFSGLFLACIGVDALLGFDGWAMVPAFFLGSRLKQLGDRARTIRWMELVQRQDAVIEQLLGQVEKPHLYPQPKQRADYV